MSLSIRTIRLGEDQVIEEIENKSDELFKEYGVDFSGLILELDEAFAIGSSPSETFVAEIDSQIVGFCTTKTVDGSCYLGQLSVHPRNSNQGIGSKLLETAFEWAKRMDFNHIVLTTFRDIKFNAPMYERRGFKIFEPGETFPELKEIRNLEKKSGIEILPRVAMIKEL